MDVGVVGEVAPQRSLGEEIEQGDGSSD